MQDEDNVELTIIVLRLLLFLRFLLSFDDPQYRQISSSTRLENRDIGQLGRHLGIVSTARSRFCCLFILYRIYAIVANLWAVGRRAKTDCLPCPLDVMRCSYLLGSVLLVCLPLAEKR